MSLGTLSNWTHVPFCVGVLDKPLDFRRWRCWAWGEVGVACKQQHTPNESDLLRCYSQTDFIIVRRIKVALSKMSTADVWEGAFQSLRVVFTLEIHNLRRPGASGNWWRLIPGLTVFPQPPTIHRPTIAHLYDVNYITMLWICTMFTYNLRQTLTKQL